MAVSLYKSEARRWVKFPATVLLAMALLWLLQSLFEFNEDRIGQTSEKAIWAAYNFIALIVIPLGSVAVGIGLLFLQRWALLIGFLLPLLPLLSVTGDKLARIDQKFSEYRATGDFSTFGGGVMTALLVIALWATFGIYVLYLQKSWRLTNQAREWLSPKARSRESRIAATGQPPPGATLTDEVCYLLPDASDDEQP